MKDDRVTSLTTYLEPEAILLGLEAESDAEVIRRLGACLEALGRVKASFVPAVLAREATMPTGLPLGGEANVAVPHTDPEHVIGAALALATLARPVSFANMEDPAERLAVRVVFLMALDDKSKQIDMLQKIAETIQRPAAIAALGEARTVAEAIAVLDASAA